MRLVLLTAALWLLLTGPARGYDLLIVQSQRSPAYDDVLKGFRSVARFSERVLVLSDYNEIDLVRVVREEAPAAIITLGDNALAAARKVRQIPVIALMALSYRAGMAGHQALTGVEVQHHPERYLALFASLTAQRVGVIANPSVSDSYLRLARRLAAGMGIELLVREVKSPREVRAQLDSMAGLVDALWMLPDSLTASGEAADAHFLFSAVHKVPVVTFSSAYLTSGAAFVLDIDRADLGRQAGEMAAALLDGAAVSAIPPAAPRRALIRSNPSVLRRLGLNPGRAVNRGFN